MAAVFAVAGVLVAVIAAIVLVFVPVRRVEAVAREFSWRRRVQIGTRVWVKKTSKRKPSGEVRNVQIENGDDPGRRHFSYEERVWRKMRWVEVSGHSQAGVRWPPYVLGKGEELRRKRESYKATFDSREARRYTAKVGFAQWRSLSKGARYQLGRNAFGAVRAVTPAKAALDQGG